MIVDDPWFCRREHKPDDEYIDGLDLSLSISLCLTLTRSVLLLFKNPTFIFLCLAGATEATLIAGMSTFGPKFLESQFSLSASEAATWFGKMLTCEICKSVFFYLWSRCEF